MRGCRWRFNSSRTNAKQDWFAHISPSQGQGAQFAYAIFASRGQAAKSAHAIFASKGQAAQPAHASTSRWAAGGRQCSSGIECYQTFRYWRSRK
jgi:hypothetical protein